MTYWADGRLKDVTDPRGFVARFDVDWTNRQNLITFALGTSLAQTVKETFDTVGFITESIDGLGHKVTYVPDSFHRLSQIKDHYGTVKLTNTFDNLSQVTHQADGLSKTTEYKIDELFRVYKIIDPNGNATQTQFDANDQAVGFIDGLGGSRLRPFPVLGPDWNDPGVDRPTHRLLLRRGRLLPPQLRHQLVVLSAPGSGKALLRQ